MEEVLSCSQGNALCTLSQPISFMVAKRGSSNLAVVLIGMREISAIVALNLSSNCLGTFMDSSLEFICLSITCVSYTSDADEFSNVLHLCVKNSIL